AIHNMFRSLIAVALLLSATSTVLIAIQRRRDSTNHTAWFSYKSQYGFDVKYPREWSVRKIAVEGLPLIVFVNEHADANIHQPLLEIHVESNPSSLPLAAFLSHRGYTLDGSQTVDIGTKRGLRFGPINGDYFAAVASRNNVLTFEYKAPTQEKDQIIEQI